jgi:hypothetical protein
MSGVRVIENCFSLEMLRLSCWGTVGGWGKREVGAGFELSKNCLSKKTFFSDNSSEFFSGSKVWSGYVGFSRFWIGKMNFDSKGNSDWALGRVWGTVSVILLPSLSTVIRLMILTDGQIFLARTWKFLVE